MCERRSVFACYTVQRPSRFFLVFCSSFCYHIAAFFGSSIEECRNVRMYIYMYTHSYVYTCLIAWRGPSIVEGETEHTYGERADDASQNRKLMAIVELLFLSILSNLGFSLLCVISHLHEQLPLIYIKVVGSSGEARWLDRIQPTMSAFSNVYIASGDNGRYKITSLSGKGGGGRI